MSSVSFAWLMFFELNCGIGNLNLAMFVGL